MMQMDVDASCYADVAVGGKPGAKHSRSRRFVDLAARAGCFVGIESINSQNFTKDYPDAAFNWHRREAELVSCGVMEKSPVSIRSDCAFADPIVPVRLCDSELKMEIPAWAFSPDS
jgi:hypothetical protein